MAVHSSLSPAETIPSGHSPSRGTASVGTANLSRGFRNTPPSGTSTGEFRNTAAPLPLSPTVAIIRLDLAAEGARLVEGMRAGVSADGPGPITAIIYVDGAEFMRLHQGDDALHWFNETVKREGGEVALMVWKPRHGIWLRERLSIRARAEGRVS